MFCCLAYSVRIRVHMVADFARLRATALAHTKVSWTTMMRMSCHSLGLWGGGRGRLAVWRHLGLFWGGGLGRFLQAAWGTLVAVPAIQQHEGNLG